MSKMKIYRQELSPLFESFFRTGNPDALTAHLVAHSNLPGPRGNLELACAFADAMAGYSAEESARLWTLCLNMTAISPGEAPVNDPREFIPFCGAVGLGALGAAMAQYLEPALRALHALANDSRWRMREGVAMGLQRLIAAYPQQTVTALQDWIAGGSWPELRAAAAAVAEPALLRDRNVALAALRLHKQILERILQATDRRSEPFRTLRKGLGYTLSVVVQAIPDEGFAWLARLVDTEDADVLWIVGENLKKNRLVRHFPEQVEALTKDMPERKSKPRAEGCVGTHPASHARVVSDYQAPYADPITVQAGDEVSVDSTKKTDWTGWVWCTYRAGKGGWVPEAYLERKGDVGHLRCDYDAVELTVKIGDVLTIHKAESGFLWVTDQAGRTGWVPSTCVEPYTSNVE